MAESFTKAVDRMATYYDDRRASLSGKKPARWSTSGFASISDMTAAFDTADLSSAYQEHYQKTTGSGQGAGGNVSKEQGFRLQLTFVAGMRRAYRHKFISSQEAPRTRVDLARYAYTDAGLTKIVISRLRDWVDSKVGAEQ